MGNHRPLTSHVEAALTERSELAEIWQQAQAAGQDCTHLVWRLLREDLVRLGIIRSGALFFPAPASIHREGVQTITVPAAPLAPGVRPQVNALVSVTDALAQTVPEPWFSRTELDALIVMQERLAKMMLRFYRVA